jgi:N-acetylmuramoyl-L-alanine amidase
MAPGKTTRLRPAFLVAMLALVAGGATAAQRAPLDNGVVAVLGDEGEPAVEATPLRGEGLLAFARRLCGSPEAAPKLAEANGGRQLLAGVRYRVPFALLTPELQRQAMAALFPGDRLETTGWYHQVEMKALQRGETLWSVAERFTGSGEAFRQLREANRLADDELRAGQTLWIPATLLRTGLRRTLPAGLGGETGVALEHRSGTDGGYAVYRLQPGEALYSSVVVRFTGRVFAEDVNALASEIATASGIGDVTDIPIGYEVRIPHDLLLPEFLPSGDPRRAEYEAELSDSSRFSNAVRTRALEGITVVLDAGHGGADVGASMNGVWESLYVYDVMVRVKSLLETRTLARVVPTIRDGSRFDVRDADVLPFSRGHQVLTTPPYPIGDSKVGVNLRWFLANNQYRRAAEGGGDARKVVFVSIHADSLHPSLRGAMVYVPGAALSGGSLTRSGDVYRARLEVREQPSAPSWRERVESEGLSRQMATATIAAFRERGLPVHPYKPIREKIIQKRGQYVPAVLRYNAIPAKMLVEVCNLANDEDRRLIQTRAFRQKVAEAIVDGILAYYGESAAPAATGTTGVVAAAGR